MNKGIIYAIVNTVNDKWYIGSTQQKEVRFMDHYNCIKGKNHPNKNIRADSKTHSVDCFKFNVLSEFDNLSRTGLLLFEMRWINGLSGHISLYNINKNTFGFKYNSQVTFDSEEDRRIYKSLRKTESFKIDQIVTQYIKAETIKNASQNIQLPPWY